MEQGLQELNNLYRFMSVRKFVASTAELTDSGFTYSKIKNWYQRGRLVKVLRGVYSLGRDIEATDAAFRAALLFSGPGSALTGRSAAEKWGLVKSSDSIPRVIEVATPSGKSRKTKGCSRALRNTVITVIRRPLEPGDIRSKDGLQLVRPALALIDLAVKAGEREVFFAFLEACRLRLFDERDLKYCFRRLAGKRGAKKLAPCLELWVPELKRIRSVLEGWFLLEWVERRLPMPEVNARTFGIEVDFFWACAGVILELDGDAFHSDPVQKRRDLERQRHLESRGMVVIRMTYKEFAANPAAAIDRIGDLLENRSGQKAVA